MATFSNVLFYAKLATVMRFVNKKVLSTSVIVVAVVAAIIGAHFLAQKKNSLPDAIENPIPLAPSSPESAFPSAGKPVVAIFPPEYSGEPIEEIHGDGVEKQFPPEMVKRYQDELAKLSKDLKAHPDNLDGWLRAGVLKKFFNDYQGARDLWEYASLVFPTNSISFLNLGNLYMLYLKDFPKSEENFKASNQNEPQEGTYLALADLYAVFWKEKEGRVVKVLAEGISKLGEKLNFYLYLAKFYADRGQKDLAKQNYQKVLQLSPGYPGVAEEIAKLEK